jgi:hypothetical protein
MYAGLIPVTVFLDEKQPPVLVGYDFWGEELRTKAVTRFLGQESAKIGNEVFADFPCTGRAEQKLRAGHEKLL